MLVLVGSVIIDDFALRPRLGFIGSDVVVEVNKPRCSFGIGIMTMTFSCGGFGMKDPFFLWLFLGSTMVVMTWTLLLSLGFLPFFFFIGVGDGDVGIVAEDCAGDVDEDEIGGADVAVILSASPAADFLRAGVCAGPL